MCMIAVRTKRRTGPRGPGLPLPWLCCQCRERPPARPVAVSPFLLRLRRCPRSVYLSTSLSPGAEGAQVPLRFSQSIYRLLFFVRLFLSRRSFPCGSACESSFCPLATDAVS